MFLGQLLVIGWAAARQGRQQVGTMVLQDPKQTLDQESGRRAFQLVWLPSPLPIVHEEVLVPRNYSTSPPKDSLPGMHPGPCD